jgi:hypothetical protein
MAIPGINLALTVVDLILATQSSDSVAIINGFTQVLQNCRPMRATVRQSSRLLDHPIENGQIISDYSVILPVEIDLQVIVTAQYYRSTAQQILQLFQTKQLLTVQLKDGNYVNMVIAEMPREEKPEMFDAFAMTIKFRQALIVKPLPTYSPLNPVQANTQAVGQQSPITIPDGASYSSVPNLTNSGYSISGVQGAGGTQTISSTSNYLSEAPIVSGVATVPPQGLQTTTSATTVSSSFGGLVPIGSQ